MADTTSLSPAYGFMVASGFNLHTLGKLYTRFPGADFLIYSGFSKSFVEQALAELVAAVGFPTERVVIMDCTRLENELRDALSHAPP